MRRSVLRRIISTVVGCDFHNESNDVRFYLSNRNDQSSASEPPKCVTVCREWIFDNDISRRHGTGQKVNSIYDDKVFASAKVGSTPFITEVDCFAAADAVAFYFEGLTEPVHVRTSDVVKYLAGRNRLPPCTPLPNVEAMHRVKYNDFLDTSSQTHARALFQLAKDGIVLVEQCSLDDEAVFRLARSVDREMPTLYDTSFKVVTTPTSGPKNNVAYTAVELDLHQDLAYHESMPGLQLLHCQAFSSLCAGGESTFLDLMNVAQRIKEKFPDAFKTLCEVPAAFMKDDWDRPTPAQYYYATPHFHVNDYGDIMKCFWAPAFEAPLPHTPRMKEYYEARRYLHKEINALKETPLYLQFRMKEGDCVIFHQARMLHGRRAFTEPGPFARQLHGCYVNVDSFRNACITRCMKAQLPVEELPGFSNRSFR